MKNDKFRMAQWLVISVLCFIAATILANFPTGSEPETGLWPRIQSLLWTAGKVNFGCWLGYWFDRRLFPENRITRLSPSAEQIRRAVIVVGTMLTVGGAL